MERDFGALFDLSISKFLIEIRNLSKDEQDWIVNNYDFSGVSYDYLVKFYFSVSDENRMKLLSDDNFFRDFVLISTNRFRHSNFYLSSLRIKVFILSNKERLDDIDFSLFGRFLSEIRDVDYEYVTSRLSYKLLFGSSEVLNDYVASEYDDKGSFVSKVKQGRRNAYWLLRIKNKESYKLYEKFGLILDVNSNLDNYVFADGCEVPKGLLDSINESHMVKVIKGLMTKEESLDNRSLQVFMVALKLYTTFGFDNSMKLIFDKFTYMTESAIKRGGETAYVDFRRNYRLNNQDKFYSYSMLVKAYDALNSGDYWFFKNVCLNESEDNLIIFMNDLKNKMISDNIDDSLSILSLELQNEIERREDYYREEYLERYRSRIVSSGYRDVLSCDELYKRLFRVGFDNIFLNERGMVILNNGLNKFLLGNCRYDNDCLFRLIVNEEALGLNNNLAYLIDNFYRMSNVMKKSKLSFSSILDVVDVMKAIIYKMDPDERDMSLETITLLLNSREHCAESGDVILARARELRRDSKKRYSSFIPYVSGKTDFGYSYELVPFDREDYIVKGIKAGTCLKVGGKGEDFLRRCMTSKDAGLISIKNRDGYEYICPVIRNGNGLFGNGIDPVVVGEEIDLVLRTLSLCYLDMMDKSYENEKIEFGTITDLHLETFFGRGLFEDIFLDKSVILNDGFYTDIDKRNIRNYVLVSDNSFKGFKSYIPTLEYMVPRRSNYFYDLSIRGEGQDDRDKLSLLVNAISYSAVDFLNLSDRTKSAMKDEYIPVDVDDYLYICGNKDWYIGVRNNYCVDSVCASYDPRVKDEMEMGFDFLKTECNIEIDGSNGNRLRVRRK